MRTLKATPDYLRADIAYSREQLKIDRENGVIYGYNVAQLGPFKDLRGEFDAKSLTMIADQINAMPKGIKMRFGHPTLSSDGIGKFLGRGREARVEGASVKANAYLDKTSLQPQPGGGTPLGGYVMDLAESDPEAFGSSLVIEPQQVLRRDSAGRPMVGDDGEPLPPLWYPKRLHASDVLDDGDAVHTGFLSSELIEGLPDAAVRKACELLDGQFQGQTREVVEARLSAWLSRYCNLRFGPSGPDVATLQRKLRNKMLDIELSGR